MANYFYVYILASQRNGTLYVGITANLIQRAWQHKNRFVKSFSSRYKVEQLVYFEQYQEAIAAIQREKQLKKWPRQWKIALIEQTNPQWRDLYNEIVT